MQISSKRSVSGIRCHDWMVMSLMLDPTAEKSNRAVSSQVMFITRRPCLSARCWVDGAWTIEPVCAITSEYASTVLMALLLSKFGLPR
ncbi:MAG: hypothetical protein U1E05_05325 [Patescibacteria group bacterium]|nr:hypothetical protein [Patescibacteria group bacterium]